MVGEALSIDSDGREGHFRGRHRFQVSLHRVYLRVRQGLQREGHGQGDSR